jgi:putative RNA 2'-phosphotransferase
MWVRDSYLVAGHAFYQAANGVSLTDHVPPGYLSGWPG